MKKFLLFSMALILTASFAFSQPSSHSTNPPAPVFVETQINSNHAPGTCTFLIFMDNLPWGSSAIQTILTANGETWSLANSNLMASIDFELYDVIIIASDQVPGFHVNFSANFAKFETFVTNGGSLEVHAATAGWNSDCIGVQLPGGVTTTCAYDNSNVIANPAHPIVAGVSNPFFGTFASHGYFNNLVTGTDIITTMQSSGQPTTIQYQYGTGIVTATTCTYEYGWSYGEEAGEMLVNNLNYGCDHAIEAEKVPLSDWAIGIGIFMIIAAAFVRYRRIF